MKSTYFLSTFLLSLGALALEGEDNFAWRAAENATAAQPDQPNTEALGRAVIINKCSFPVFLWSTGPNGSPANPKKIEKRSRYSEPYRNPKDGGISLKVAKSRQLRDDNIVQFEYTIDKNELFYDLSFVNCADGRDASACPGHGAGLKINGWGNFCKTVTCAPGAYCPRQAYYDPDGPDGPYEPTKSCGKGHLKGNLEFTMCTSNAPLKRGIAGRVAMTEDIEAEE